MSDPAGERAPRRRSPGAPAAGAAGDDVQARPTRRSPASGTGAGRAARGAEISSTGPETPPPVRDRTPRRAAGRAEEPADTARSADPAPGGAERASTQRSGTTRRRAGATPATEGGGRDSTAVPRRRTGRTSRTSGNQAAARETDPDTGGDTSGDTSGSADGGPGTASPGRTGRASRGSAGPPADPGSPGATGEPPVRGPGGRWPMSHRSVLATVLGVPPVAAVGLAVTLTAIGVLIDLTRIGGLGTVFTVCYISGCVLAVAWVRRIGLFGPMVQPPLLVAVSVPVVVLLAGSPRPGQGVAERMLVIGAPLVNAFPVMAWTTGIVLVLGLLRVLLQRPVDAPALSGRSGRGAARGAGRRSTSPRRS